ncbi:11340_t:CDS:1, partial [Ambispora leptoticha]
CGFSLAELLCICHIDPWELKAHRERSSQFLQCSCAPEILWSPNENDELRWLWKSLNESTTGELCLLWKIFVN